MGVFVKLKNLLGHLLNYVTDNFQMVILVFNIDLSQRKELKLIKQGWIMVAISTLLLWVSVTIWFMSGKLNYYGWCCPSHTAAILSLRVHSSTLDVWFSGMTFRDSVHHLFLLKHIQQSNQTNKAGNDWLKYDSSLYFLCLIVPDVYSISLIIRAN